jgi:cytochrome c-type biogenesis protein
MQEESLQYKVPRDWSVFFSSVFFVLGFSIIFSIVGVLLQTVLLHSSLIVKTWLGYAGGIIIILFGLFLLGLFTPAFLTRDHKFAVRGNFKSRYATSFLFGAAFAVGWTPCVSAALGAILALATVNPGSAFFLLFAYTLGLGIPFLVVGAFTNQAQDFINRAGKWLKYVEYVFGVILVAIGIFIFTGELSMVANVQFLTNILVALHLSSSAGGSIASLSLVNLAIALFAGLTSFLSPCVLPIIPGFLSYLAESSINKETV